MKAPVETVLFGVLAAVLGLPHGALDPVVARRVGLWRTPAGLAVFTLGYLAVSAALGAPPSRRLPG